ncbi:MAG: sigma-70 family RNA polymerase sigma factor [bacterium]|nr:sigma-70 family RNA polymerase sigma factor [bacterium]
MRSDEDLMVRVQAGDEAALETLMGRFKGPLFGFLNRRVGASAADDLFQESWIRVVKARDRFDPRRRFSTWLFQIANNLCRDRGRHLLVEARHRDRVLGEASAAPAPRPATPALTDRMDMARHLAALPDPLREVLVLRYYQDLSEREIAEVLGIPRGTVKSRAHAAVKALRQQVERIEQLDQVDGTAEETGDA